MAYKKVKLLNESGDEELYPETDWSIVRNTPIDVDAQNIEISAKNFVSFISSPKGHSTVDTPCRPISDQVSFTTNEIYLSNEKTNGRSLLYTHYPRTEKSLSEVLNGSFFGSVIFTNEHSNDYGKTFPAIGIGEWDSTEHRISGYSFLYFNGTEFLPVDFNQMSYIPINRTSGIL